MDRKEILEGLKEILLLIKPSLDLSTVTEGSQLISDIGLDSLTIMLLSLAIENKFKIKFEGTLKFNTVGEVIDYIQSKA
ncbi:MAG: phosphopantetheine-binding protein [Bacteroidales bacterium]|nr:phosphopantetheine-binding protein [Bacteroidales bacterium]